MLGAGRAIPGQEFVLIASYKALGLHTRLNSPYNVLKEICDHPGLYYWLRPATRASFISLDITLVIS